MSIFRCVECGVVENTACSNFWSREDKFKVLCSQCDPETKKWHNVFPRQSAKGYVLASDGFLYHKENVESDSFKFRMRHQGLTVVREITEEGQP